MSSFSHYSHPEREPVRSAGVQWLADWLQDAAEMPDAVRSSILACPSCSMPVSVRRSRHREAFVFSHPRSDCPREKRVDHVPGAGQGCGDREVENFMKTPEELHDSQSKMSPLRSYFVVWERPHGSFTWTLMLARAMERAEADDMARARVDSKTCRVCDCVVTEVKLTRMPTPEGSEPIAILPNEQGPVTVYHGKGHAR